MSPKKDTQKSAKSTTAAHKTSRGFTDEERAAMKERAQELKAEARRGPRGDKADGEGAVRRVEREDAGLQLGERDAVIRTGELLAEQHRGAVDDVDPDQPVHPDWAMQRVAA